MEILKQEIDDLKERLARLEAKGQPVAKPTWREAIGTSKGDEIDREAARLGAEWRAQENQRP